MSNLIVRTRPYTLSQDVDRMFDNLFGTISLGSQSRNIAVDVIETSDGYNLLAELAGYKESDVTIKVEDNLLIIESAQESSKDEEVKWLIRERAGRKFRRSFALPKDADQETISAVFADGLLTLTIPKSEKAKPRTITIQRG